MCSIVGTLGQGAFGTVYHLQLPDRCEFALKVAETGRLQKGEASAEAKLMLKLCHAHLVQCAAFYQDKRRTYLVLELCPGGTLAQFLMGRTKLLPEQRVLTWLAQMADALRYLHASKVIHRDLKTDNVFLLNDKQNIKIGDLGIARELDYTNQKAGTFIGTICYMSPEVLQNSTYSYKADVWSLGCCIHEVMTQRRTFAGSSLLAVFESIMESRIPIMPDIYSRELKKLVLNLLEREPDNRPDGLEILLAITNIQGFPFQPAPLVRMNTVCLSKQLLRKTVENFENKKRKYVQAENTAEELNIPEKCESHLGALSDSEIENFERVFEANSHHISLSQNLLQETSCHISASETLLQEKQQEVRGYQLRHNRNQEQTENLTKGDLSSPPRDSLVVVPASLFHLPSSLYTSSGTRSVTSSTFGIQQPTNHDTLQSTKQHFSKSKHETSELLGLSHHKTSEYRVEEEDSDCPVTLYTRAQLVKYKKTKTPTSR